MNSSKTGGLCRARSGGGWRTRWRAAAVVALCAAVFAAACGGGGERPLVFAAASLADVLEEAADAYFEETGRQVDFSFGGSSSLTNQIARLGAPADGAIFAGPGPMEKLVEAKKVDPAGVTVIAGNSLVVVAQRGAAPISRLRDLVAADGLIAIADPDLAPAGEYARSALVSAGAYEELLPDIVPTLNVRAALAAVSTGGAKFAIVYRTDAVSEPDVTVVLDIPPDLHAGITYPAAAVDGAEYAGEAQRFFEFLATGAARAIFTKHGFAPPDEAPR